MNKAHRKRAFIKGLAAGLLFPGLGFVIYGLYWSFEFGRTLAYFVHEVFLAVPTHRSAILSLSLLADLLPFFFFIRREEYHAARGVIAAMFVYAPLIVYFRFIT